MPGPSLTNPGYQFDTFLVANPALTQNLDNNPSPITGGRHGDLLVSRAHGTKYVSRARGNGFVYSSGAAGVSIIAAAQTTGSWVLYNPVGSGVLIDLERIHISGATVETDVISGLALEGSLQTPSGTLTKATPATFQLGAGRGSNQGIVYSAGPTLTAMTFLCGLGLTITATTSPMPVGIVDLDGTIVLAPGYAVNLVSAITQGTNKLIVDFFTSEWPI